MGACLQVPFTTVENWPSGLAMLRRAGYHVVALTPDRTATLLQDFAPPQVGQGVALLLGSEGAGLSDGASTHADTAVKIDMRGTVDSLNVATAAAIALHELGTRNGQSP